MNSNNNIESLGNLIDNLNPISYWQLDETTGKILEDAIGSHDGTYVSRVNLDISGVNNSAAQFDGQNSYGIIPHRNAFNLEQGSLQLWFNPQKIDDRQGLISRDSSGYDGGGHFGLLIENGRLRLRSQSTSATKELYSAKNSLVTDSWQQAVVTWGDGGLKLYLNGEQVAADTNWTQGWQGNSEPIVLGTNQWISGDGVANKLRDFYQGELDEVALYQQALDKDEIQSLYRAGIASEEPSPDPTPVINTPPEANDDSYETDFDTTLSIDIDSLRANDRDLETERELLTVNTGNTTAQGGSLKLTANESLIYTPPSGFSGIDTFSYTLADPQGASDNALVSIEVNSEPIEPPNSDNSKNLGNLIDNLNPISYWQLDETTGKILEDAIGSHDGTYVSRVNLDISGVNNSAAQFDGQNSYGIIPHRNAFNLEQGSLQLWFNPQKIDDRQGLISRDSSGYDGGGHFGLLIENGRLRLRSQSTSATKELYSAKNSLVTDSWQQAVVTWDDGGLKLYLNGEQVAADTNWTQGWQGNSEPIVLGTNQWISGDGVANKLRDFYQGELDEVALYQQTLDEDEIQSLYRAGIASQEPSPDPIPENDGELLLNAGKDFSVAALSWVGTKLSGSINVDGNSNIFTTTWKQLSGPGVATFSDSSVLETQVSFSKPGTYVLQLEASDGISTINDEIEIEVTRPEVKIMPLGDSITHGDTEYSSYRRSLWHKLQAEGFENIDFVGSLKTNSGGPNPNPDFDLDHEGHAGWTVDRILNRLDGWAATFQPDIALIHLGTNDMLRGQSVESTIEELEDTIDVLRVHNPNTAILLAQIIPSKRSNSKIRDLNEQIPSLAAAKNRLGSPVIVVDQYTGFDLNNDTYDLIHPNVSGEEKYAANWFAELDDLLV